jgi:hypothetical protein
MFTMKAPEANKEMETREDNLNELATNLSTAIAQARQLKLPTSVYILSMALVEVLQATKADAESGEDDAAR